MIFILVSDSDVIVLTHILHMESVKRSSKLLVAVDCFTSLPLAIGFSSLLQKMWVRIRAQARGLLLRFDEEEIRWHVTH